MKTLIRLVRNRSLNQRSLLQSVRLAWMSAAILTGCPASDGSSVENARGDPGEDDYYEDAAYCGDEVVSRFDCSAAPEPETIFSLSQLGINISTIPTIAVDDQFLYVSLGDFEHPEAGGTYRVANDGSTFTKLTSGRYNQMLVVGDRLFVNGTDLWSMKKDGTDLREHSLFKSTNWSNYPYGSLENIVLGEDGRIFGSTDKYCTKDEPSEILAFDPVTETTAEIAKDTCIREFALGAGYVYWAQRDIETDVERLRRAPISGGPTSTLATAPDEWRWSGLGIAGARLYAMVSDGVGDDESVEMNLDGTELKCIAPAGVGTVYQTGDGVIARLSAIQGPDCVLQLGHGKITVVGDASTSAFGFGSAVVTDGEFVYSAGASDIQRLPLPAQNPDDDLPMTLPR